PVAGPTAAAGPPLASPPLASPLRPDRRWPDRRWPHRRGRTAAAGRPRTGRGRLAAVRVLVVGSGGREHALSRALAADPEVTSLHAAPGNPGIARLAELHPVTVTDPEAITMLAARLDADLVVIGPEAPLVAGAA